MRLSLISLRRLALALVFSASLSLTTGCVLLVAGAAGAGGTAYVMGALEFHSDKSPDQIAPAISKAFRSLDIAEVSMTAGKLDGQAIGRTKLDDKVSVTMERVEGGQTEVKIRFGAFGDEAKSRQLQEEIIKRL